MVSHISIAQNGRHTSGMSQAVEVYFQTETLSFTWIKIIMGMGVFQGKYSILLYLRKKASQQLKRGACLNSFGRNIGWE
jgi:hypothetical protein